MKPVSTSQFFSNLLTFLWNGKYSVAQGKKTAELWAKSQELASTIILSIPVIDTEEFTFKPLREKPPQPPSRCCQQHGSCDVEMGGGERQPNPVDLPPAVVTMER
jgi:hypothetical protein